MTKHRKIQLVILLWIVSFSSFAQKEKMIGLWEIEKVEVGEENMTPVAKWTKINEDGTFQSGNGWLQNSSGTWQYDPKNNRYSSIDSLDIYDEFGGFQVSFDDQTMFWERQEEGMKVRVSLKAVDELPMSPADFLEGMWKLTDISDHGNSILDDFDAAHRHKLFIRWDRIYMDFSPEGKKLTGYWHIHGHRSEITLLPHQDGGIAESWMVEVNDSELIMNGNSDSNRNIQRVYTRTNSF